LVLDDKGKKMSKSKGNVIDPLDMIEKYGTDATRLSLVIGSTPGNDMRLSEEKVAGFRNLVNKLWNISRFILQNQETSIINQAIDEEKLTDADCWILNKMFGLISLITEDLDNYRFSQAGERLREFTWDDLADWYLEATKFDNSSEKDKILFIILRDLLKLWHPFIPFVTEVIWKELEQEKDLIISEWPGDGFYNEFKGFDGRLENFRLIKELIKDIRNVRAENKVEPARKIEALIIAGEKENLIKENISLIKGMRTGIEKIEIKKDGEDIADAIKVVSGEIKIFLIGARDEAKEKARLKKRKAELEKLIAGIKNKLGNQSFVENAPEVVVEKEKERLKSFEDELKEIA